jgi:hypothetical protein
LFINQIKTDPAFFADFDNLLLADSQTETRKNREIMTFTIEMSLKRIKRLNEFNLSISNFKYLDRKFGSVQKLFARDTDLVVFQDDKYLKFFMVRTYLLMQLEEVR